MIELMRSTKLLSVFIDDYISTSRYILTNHVMPILKENNQTQSKVEI